MIVAIWAKIPQAHMRKADKHIDSLLIHTVSYAWRRESELSELLIVYLIVVDNGETKVAPAVPSYLPPRDQCLRCTQVKA